MKRFKNILYVSEDSVVQDSALARAISLANNNQADLTVMSVMEEITHGITIPDDVHIASDLQTLIQSEHYKSLELLVEPFKDQLNIKLKALVGKRFHEVIRAVLRHDYDLVIKAAENPGWMDRLFGSDDMHLLRKCPCPVWFMKPDEKSNYKTIVAAIEFDPADISTVDDDLNRTILSLSSSLALSDFANLHLVHAWDAPEAGFVSLWADNPAEAENNITEGEHLRHQRGMDMIYKNLRQQINEDAFKYIAPHVHLLKGSAAKEIPALVNQLDADLVVMGTIARTGIPGLIIGNTAEAILDQLKCSVLAVKPTGFVSPVTIE